MLGTVAVRDDICVPQLWDMGNGSIKSTAAVEDTLGVHSPVLKLPL